MLYMSKCIDCGSILLSTMPPVQGGLCEMCKVDDAYTTSLKILQDKS